MKMITPSVAHAPRSVQAGGSRPPRPTRRRALVTYGWCRTAYVTAVALSEAGWDVVVCDASRLAMCRCSRYVRRFHRVPHHEAEPRAYAAAIGRLAALEQADVIVPIHEDAVALRQFESLLPPDAVLACPTLQQLERTLDKSSFLAVAESAGVPIPVTCRPTSLDEVRRQAAGFPGRIVVKSRTGNSGRGVAVVADANAAVAAVSGFVATSAAAEEWPLLQHYVAGQVHGSCFLADRGRVVACFTERYLRCKEGGFGTSVFRESIESPELVGHTVRLVEALDWTGLGHFDFIVPPDGGEPRLLEMNPRPWGALKLAVAHGYNFPVALAAQALGDPPAGELLRPRRDRTRCMWIVGELIAAVSELRHGRVAAPLTALGRIVRPGADCVYDDFSWSDPLPLFAEAAHYGSRFFASGGSFTPGM